MIASVVSTIAPEKGFDLDAAVGSLRDLVHAMIARLPYVAFGLVLFTLFVFLGKLAGRVTRRASTRLKAEPALSELLGRIARVSVMLLGAAGAAVVIFPGLNVGDLVAGLGISSIAIGFALKDVLQNFVAGVLLLVRRPFRVGDEIRTRDHEGTVEAIDVRATRIITYDGERVIVPNGDVYTNVVVVRTAKPTRRIEVRVGIGYEDAIDEAREVIHRALAETAGVEKDPPPFVGVIELAPSAVVVQVFFWTGSSQANVVTVRDRVVDGIKRALDDAGIDMPYPHTVVVIDSRERGPRAGATHNMPLRP